MKEFFWLILIFVLLSSAACLTKEKLSDTNTSSSSCAHNQGTDVKEYTNYCENCGDLDVVYKRIYCNICGEIISTDINYYDCSCGRDNTRNKTFII